MTIALISSAQGQVSEGGAWGASGRNAGLDWMIMGITGGGQVGDAAFYTPSMSALAMTWRLYLDRAHFIHSLQLDAGRVPLDRRRPSSIGAASPGKIV